MGVHGATGGLIGNTVMICGGSHSHQGRQRIRKKPIGPIGHPGKRGRQRIRKKTIGPIGHPGKPQNLKRSLASTEYVNDCYSLTSQKSTLVTHMSEGRFEAASIVLNDNTLWVTGGMKKRIRKKTIGPIGHPGKPQNLKRSFASTEYVTMTGTTPGPDLPKALSGHAMVAINSTFSMVIGGGYSKKTFYYNHIEG